MSQDAKAAFAQLRERLSEAVIGQPAVIEALLMALLADGHVLLEGLPGLAKTRAIKALGRELRAPLARIQFTPDLLPSDLVGAEIYHQGGPEGSRFVFQPGPVFAPLVLADEINRAPAKVQSALLEAMEERQVTVAGQTHRLPQPFLVMATQNPIEQEGTYPLPEAQTDRFLMKVVIGYAGREAEGDIMRLVRAEEGGKLAAAPAAPVNNPIGPTSAPAPATPSQAQGSALDHLAQARRGVHAMHVAEAIERYIVDLVQATREPASVGEDVGRWIEVGASPRGTIALDRCARAHAWLQGRDFVGPDNVRAVAHACLRHRLLLSHEALAAGVQADQVVDRLLAAVAAP
ncbi:MAG: AAA family ATPase [Roseateles asaccharophilus]|uniref:AAA family ATPase n=1 Tax=Roseateles asaccharophilus TaxID=582607 RepID=UPI00391B62A0